MDKIKAFLTQKINKDSFKDHDVKRSIKLTICGALIIALMIQAIGCFCAPFTVSAVDDDSIVGTWVFNDTLDFSTFQTIGRYSVSLDFVSNDINQKSFVVETKQLSSGSLYWSLIYVRDNTSSTETYCYSSFDGGWGYNYTSLNYKTIIINSDPNDDVFKSWLKSNATKQVTQVYDFTGETRIFNDELTLFNTSEATWNDAWGFNFEVLGVGTADYLHLSRDTRNWYTMSYSFDFEGSGGLTMIYRDTPPLDDGNGEWLGGKVNRKVITFLSNPDDPEFQQWLLDNTELYDDVDSAYQIGFTSGYNNGYEEGFSNKLIGDTLKGPIEALSALTIIEVQGVAITLGGVVMTAIALCLVLAFLKLYAGG